MARFRYLVIIDHWHRQFLRLQLYPAHTFSNCFVFCRTQVNRFQLFVAAISLVVILVVRQPAHCRRTRKNRRFADRRRNRQEYGNLVLVSPDFGTDKPNRLMDFIRDGFERGDLAFLHATPLLIIQRKVDFVPPRIAQRRRVVDNPVASAATPSMRGRQNYSRL